MLRQIASSSLSMACSSRLAIAVRATPMRMSRLRVGTTVIGGTVPPWSQSSCSSTRSYSNAASNLWAPSARPAT